MKTYENIKQLREKMGMSQEELALKVGYKDRSSIAKIESGKVDLAQSKIAAFAAALNTTPAELMGVENLPIVFAPKASGSLPKNIIPLPKMKKLPLVGAIACGQPILAEEHIEDFMAAPDDVNADFCLRCKGDSMINARIFDGDIVYIRQQETVDNGQIAAVLVDGGEATLKRVRLFEDHISLEPENPMYKPLVFWNEDMNQVRILGRAVAFTSVVC